MDRELIIVQMGWPLIVILEEMIFRGFYTECSAAKLTERINRVAVYGKVDQEDVESQLKMLEIAEKIHRIKTASDDCFQIPINRNRITAA